MERLAITPTPKLGNRIILRRWNNKKPTDIVEHPLPVPKPWPRGLNGEEEPPWALHYVVYFCDPQTGSLYIVREQAPGREARLRAAGRADRCHVGSAWRVRRPGRRRVVCRRARAIVEIYQ